MLQLFNTTVAAVIGSTIGSVLDMAVTGKPFDIVIWGLAIVVSVPALMFVNRKKRS